MASITATVTALTPEDTKWVSGGFASTHSALTDSPRIRSLGNCVEIFVSKKLTAPIASGATLLKLSQASMNRIAGVVFPVWGTLLRYTGDTDTAPDIRRVQLLADGTLVNNGGLACSAGHSVIIELKAIGG